MTDFDIAIIGAGPYGLMAAAHLGSADSFSIAGFGEPMSFWDDQMPEGVLLRSPYVACNIGDPDGKLSLPRYEEAIGERPVEPVPLTRFVDYGRWFQQQALPELSSERIREVARNGNGFNLTLENGERLHAGRVVVAAGIADFKWFPEVFRELPRGLVGHACEHDDLSVFSGTSVLVVGGGQSALESAALLAEAGASVEVAARAPEVSWLSRRWHHKLGPVSRCCTRRPMSARPASAGWWPAPAFRAMPRRLQTWMTRKALRPAGAGWLPPRLGARSRSRSGDRRGPGDREERTRGLEFDDGSAARSITCCSARGTASTSRATRSSPASSSTRSRP